MAKSKDRNKEKEGRSRKRRRGERGRSPSGERDSTRKKLHKHKSSRNSPRGSRNHAHEDDRPSRKDSGKKRKAQSSSTRKDKEKKKKKTNEPGRSSSNSRKRISGERNVDHESTGDIQAEIQISEKDYFARASEFKAWLIQKKKTNFEDLTSEQSREHFKKFVKDWNRGKLSRDYYEGKIPRTIKTQHKWGFVNKLSERDQMQLDMANDSVHVSTEKVNGVASNVPVLPTGSATTVAAATKEEGSHPGRSKDERDNNDERSTEKRRRRRQERDKHAVALDEIAPKETGRQAIMDKRREVGSRTHAAARAREDGADGLDMREADTMGGGDSFHETLARTKMSQQRRQAAKTEHLQGLAAKEEQKRADFLAQMGLKAGQRITIKPRNDG